MNEQLKYLGYSIVCQEVPDEVSLAINISGCPRHCIACHSTHLWEYEGHYISDDIENLMSQYYKYITCVCFMGGDQNQDELLKIIREIKQNYCKKICLYSGADSTHEINYDILRELDYVKVGSYQQNRGGLDSVITNQSFYKIERRQIEFKDKCCEQLHFIDKTYYFRKDLLV